MPVFKLPLQLACDAVSMSPCRRWSGGKPPPPTGNMFPVTIDSYRLVLLGFELGRGKNLKCSHKPLFRC